MQVPSEPADECQPAALAAVAGQLFADGPLKLRLLQRYRPYLCPFHKLLPLVPPSATVLDAGCGGGLFLGLLASTRGLARGLGFDSSPEAIEVARRMSLRLPATVAAHSTQHTAHSTRSQLTFEHRRVEDRWPDEEFDVVSLIDVMHHVAPTEQRTLIHLAAERVRPGGLLLYKDMCQRPLWRATANRAHDLLLARQWIHYVPIASVITWARDEGLTAERQEVLNQLWYGHELVVFRREVGKD